MNKKIILTESELVKLIETIVEKQSGGLLNEQGGAYRFVRHYIGNTVDDLFKMYGDDGMQKIESAMARGLGNRINYIVRNGETFILSKSGAEIPLKTLNAAMKAVADGKHTMEEIVQYLPRQLADGTEFRSVFANIKPKPQVQAAAGSAAKSALSAFEQKHLLKDCFSNSYCNTKVIFSNFLGKLSNTARIFAFNPSKVRVNERAVVAGREILDVTLEDGTRVLFYKSSGANVGTTGKQAGEWFVIPGFAENGWFFKTHETIALTKGNNKYLTEFAEYLQTKGPGMLGR
jgi:hypothetical protein